MPFQICRICYKRGYDLLKLEDDPNNYEKKLSSCIPEIDIYIIDNPGICIKCADMLNTAFELRNLCLENEKRYNSTFNEKINESATLNYSPIHCINEDSYGEESDNQPLIGFSQRKEETTIFCSICNEEFSSNHDKKFHDFKNHRQLQHRHLKHLLSPIKTNSKNLLVESMQNTTESDTVQPARDDRNATVPDVDEHKDITTFICAECNVTFTNDHELNSHKLIHAKKYCDLCSKSFDLENEYNDHIKLHSIKCCGETFPTTSLLQLHTYREHKMGCGLCGQDYMQFGELFSHLLDHVKGNWYKCDVCGKYFKTEDLLNEHVCKSSYSPREEYDEYMEVQKVQVEFNKAKLFRTYKKYMCKKCNVGFRTRSLQTKHRLSAHTFYLTNIGKTSLKYFEAPNLQCNVFVCCLCEKEYLLHIQLQMHVLQVHCDKMPIVPIIDCRKDSFYRDQEGLRIDFHIPSENLTQPKNVKIIRKEFVARSRCICFICRILFGSVTSLYLHGRKEHLSCCNRDITSVPMFLEHNVAHYKQRDKNEDNNNLSYCSMCNKSQKNYVSLLDHRCKNTNAITVRRSSVGNEKLNSRCTIEDHESDSSDDNQSEPVTQASNTSSARMTACEICKKQFAFKSHLMDHIKTHI